MQRNRFNLFEWTIIWMFLFSIWIACLVCPNFPYWYVMRLFTLKMTKKKKKKKTKRALFVKTTVERFFRVSVIFAFCREWIYALIIFANQHWQQTFTEPIWAYSPFYSQTIFSILLVFFIWHDVFRYFVARRQASLLSVGVRSHMWVNVVTSLELEFAGNNFA